MDHIKELRLLAGLENYSRDYVNKAMLSAADEIERLTTTSLEKRTAQPSADKKLPIDAAMKEAIRCRRYLDPVLNEVVIVVLADEIERLRTAMHLIEAQDQGCGGNLRPEEIYRSMQRVVRETLGPC